MILSQTIFIKVGKLLEVGLLLKLFHKINKGVTIKFKTRMNKNKKKRWLINLIKDFKIYQNLFIMDQNNNCQN